MEPCGNNSTTNTYQSSLVEAKQKNHHKHFYLSLLFGVKFFGSLYLILFYLECMKVIFIHTFRYKMIKYGQLSYPKFSPPFSFYLAYCYIHLHIHIHLYHSFTLTFSKQTSRIQSFLSLMTDRELGFSGSQTYAFWWCTQVERLICWTKFHETIFLYFWFLLNCILGIGLIARGWLWLI